ncbi:MAG: tRNA (N6-isopentenyl adenosine(37)-C2)-methylthiotransferase MiaB [Candidatus Saganbacteria bacterium]|nr:tRNA (N6-isopentenyl adenosine(37)-C2)-methylthiotransferase MiaB [Candidatus Saganbacteria bacterium]
MTKRYYIKTYGCQMNVNDSERLAGVLETHGFTRTENAQNADIILINTCCVREHAENKALGFIGSLRNPKGKNPDLIICVCGCLPVEPGMDIRGRFSHVDLVFGPNQPEKLIEFLNRLEPRRLRPEAQTEGLVSGSTEYLIKRESSVTAWITIINGCNNFCSFCIVPYVRGREVSRSKENILKEIEGLDNNIYKEVVLLGQNVNSYRQGIGLADLLREANRIDGIERIRFLTSHPRDMSDGIIEAVNELPKVCEYFHLPLQSGDDEILKKMNRGYASDYYRKLVEKIRSRIPEAAITSDAVVGFPGESDKQFEATCNLIKELELDSVITAKYSIRPGTAAAKMDGHLPENIKQERLQKIMKVVEETALRVNQRLVGKEVEVLVDKFEDLSLPALPVRQAGGKAGSKCIGRTRTNKTVALKGNNNLVGKLINVKIKSGKSFVLEGELVS